MSLDHIDCPLCGGRDTRAGVKGQTLFHECQTCRLIFKDRSVWPSLEVEREQYDLHENQIDDIRYRQYLERLVEPLALRLLPKASGLDYGSGRHPSIEVLMRERGFTCLSYDLLYLNQESRIEIHEGGRYDFISCSETAEHFRAPGFEFERLVQLLKPGGWLAVMTQAPPPFESFEFETWWYHRDPTHLVFYSGVTQEWIANLFGNKPQFEKHSVVLFQKRSGDPAGA